MSTEESIQIISVERIDGSEVVIEFSDGTYAVLTTQEVIACVRERQQAHPRTNGENNGKPE